MKRLALIPLLAGMIVVGCKSPDDELAPAFVPKAHAFEGEVDKKYAGTWRSVDGSSTLGLGEDGTLKVETVTPTPSGKSTSKVDGKWRISGTSLMMQYGDSGKETVLKYTTTLSGDEMKVKPDGSHRETTYKRK